MSLAKFPGRVEYGPGERDRDNAYPGHTTSSPFGSIGDIVSSTRSVRVNGKLVEEITFGRGKFAASLVYVNGVLVANASYKPKAFDEVVHGLESK